MELFDRVAYRLKLRDVRLLHAVVRLKSMAKAAAHLHMSQPAVSKAVAELEHVLGVRLLDRSRQGVAPTQYGQALLDCGAAMFDDLRQGVQRIEFLADPAGGEVRLGCHPFMAVSFAAAVVDRLSRSHPRIVFRLVIAEAEKLLYELSERNVDLLITRKWSPIADERMSFEPLFEESFVVVAGAHHPWARRRRISLAELMGEAWILPPPDTGFGVVVAEAFRSCGLDYPRATVETTPPEVRISLLTTGRFLTIFPASALRFPSKRPGLKALPVELPIAHVPSGIVTLNNRTLSPVASLVIQAARALAKAPQLRN